ncbi:MAG: RNA 2',3'-cyclic phosphodiesterase [Actinomycetia bacterium]|nr:RNA 2',3'-cyclic phosphodiesterase [Actinomycetes bacterium]
MSGHAFLAADLSSEERHSLSHALSDANSGRPIPGRRPPAENWHITLRFLGECGDPQTDLVMHRLSDTVSASPSRVWCEGLGAFPRPSRAGVVFAAVDDPTDILGHLAGVCEEAAIDAGFEPEDRPYVPHLTLSRLRPALDVRSLFAALGEFRVPIKVRAITLLRTNGPRYDTLDTLPLV